MTTAFVDANTMTMEVEPQQQSCSTLSEVEKEERRQSAIRKMSSAVWNVDNVHAFQVEAIMNLAFTKKKRVRVLPSRFD